MAFRRRKLAYNTGEFDQHFELIGVCVAFAHRSTYALIDNPASDRVSAVFSRALNQRVEGSSPSGGTSVRLLESGDVQALGGCSEDCQIPGGWPITLLNARLNAASEL